MVDPSMRVAIARRGEGAAVLMVPFMLLPSMRPV
jgi:hypothetical protein